ncbi:MAG: pyridoxamine 5'-phosphate oxidase family protein [Acidimicrobiales bacterium]
MNGDSTRLPFRDGSGAELLSQHECRRLLATAEMGRMALSVHGLPVDFALTGDGIVVSTARDSWVHAATHDTVVAFEVDGLDPTGASRWSVVVVGVATEASHITPDERIGLIGERMFLAEKTVKNYVSNILMKLGMSRRTEAAGLRSPAERAPPATRQRLTHSDARRLRVGLTMHPRERCNGPWPPAWPALTLDTGGRWSPGPGRRAGDAAGMATPQRAGGQGSRVALAFLAPKPRQERGLGCCGCGESQATDTASRSLGRSGSTAANAWLRGVTKK